MKTLYMVYYFKQTNFYSIKKMSEKYLIFPICLQQKTALRLLSLSRFRKMRFCSLMQEIIDRYVEKLEVDLTVDILYSSKEWFVFTTKKQIGMNIAKFRKSKKLSQNQLGLLTHLDRKVIERIESGQRNLDLFEAVVLSKALDCDLMDLIPGEHFD